MGAKHTKGPWRISDPETDGEEFSIGNGTKTIGWVADSWDEGADGGAGQAWVSDEDKANARLIAAAPELLANVKQLRHLIRQFIDGTLVSFPVSAFAQADDAIARAEGSAAE